MAYTLSQFCKDANTILKSHPQAEALPKVAENIVRVERIHLSMK